MKKIFFAILLAVSAPAFSQTLTEANALYSVEKYDAAIGVYEQLLAQGKESAALYYNLGNAYFKTNRLAPAILNYERSLLRDPNNKDAAFNLMLAKERTVDRIEAVEPFSLTNWFVQIGNWAGSDAWAAWSVALFVFALACFLLVVFVRLAWLRKTAFSVFCTSMVLAFFCGNFARMQKNKLQSHDFAVIFSDTVTVKGSPDESGTELFLLHEGTKVHILNSFGNQNEWYEIELEDGNSGWLRSDVMQII